MDLQHSPSNQLSDEGFQAACRCGILEALSYHMEGDFKLHLTIALVATAAAVIATAHLFG